MTISSKRAEYLALMSLILSVVFFGIAFFLGRWSGFLAVYRLSWLLLSAAFVCFVLVIQFHQRALAEQEKLDMSQSAGDEKASKIFQAKVEHADLFAVAQRRLKILEKWFIPIFAAVIAAYQIGIGLYLFKSAQSKSDIEYRQALLCAVFMTAIAFVSFLVSRYAAGMSVQPQWKPLRAAGSFLFADAILCFAVAVGLALAQFRIFVVVNIVAVAVPVLLIALGVETALNVVLDIYRPRLKDQYTRVAFDSRLLGLISEPGGILRSAAETIDYQFGFKVSQTWFYKLLEKAIIPLVLFSAVTLYLLSCIIVVTPNEEVVIEHFGNPFDQAGQVRRHGPGLSFKWPWPIDIAYRYPTKKISEISVGFVPKIDPKAEKVGYGPLLWGQSHYEKEYQLIVASEQTGTPSAEAVPVSLIMASVPVQYRVKDLYSFIYNHEKSEKVLESICYRELTKFAAGSKIEVDTEEDLQHSLLGAGRNEAKEILTREIQAAADREKLGVEIIFVGMQGIHPPPEVARDYQKVVGAVQKKQALIMEAHAERNKNLSTLAGSVEHADRLYSLARQYQLIKESKDANAIDDVVKKLDNAFTNAKGDIFSTLRGAQSYAFERSTLARATGERFSSQVKAFRAAKDIYVREQRLMVFEQGLEKMRKFVVVAEPNERQVFIIDLQEKLTPSLYDMAVLEEQKKK
jgi:regulator of protease activity HflC (stomatin/prohibitin superfamily)